MNAAELYEELQASLPARLQTYWGEAEVIFVQPTNPVPAFSRDRFGVLDLVEPYLICEGVTKAKISAYGSKPCTRRAGQGTDHDGIGLCSVHNGGIGRGKAVGAILMAMAYADELNISPWEALLQQVRLLANQVEWLRGQVAMAEVLYGADGLKPGGAGWDWVALLEARGDRLAKVSKMAIDAGVAERLVRQIELEADLMVKAATATLQMLGVDDDRRAEALAFMSAKILELEAAQTPWPEAENA